MVTVSTVLQRKFLNVDVALYLLSFRFRLSRSLSLSCSRPSTEVNDRNRPPRFVHLLASLTHDPLLESFACWVRGAESGRRVGFRGWTRGDRSCDDRKDVMQKREKSRPDASSRGGRCAGVCARARAVWAGRCWSAAGMRGRVAP